MADGAAQNECDGDQAVSGEVGSPYRVGHFSGIRLRNVEEIQVRGDADQHCLHEVERDQGVELSGPGVGIEKNCHGKRSEPETEQKVFDAAHHRGRGDIIVDTEALGHEQDQVGESSETPEGERHALGSAAGRDDGQISTIASVSWIRSERKGPGGLVPTEATTNTCASHNTRGNGNHNRLARQSLPLLQKSIYR